MYVILLNWNVKLHLITCSLPKTHNIIGNSRSITILWSQAMKNIQEFVEQTFFYTIDTRSFKFRTINFHRNKCKNMDLAKLIWWHFTLLSNPYTIQTTIKKTLHKLIHTKASNSLHIPTYNKKGAINYCLHYLHKTLKCIIWSVNKTTALWLQFNAFLHSKLHFIWVYARMCEFVI